VRDGLCATIEEMPWLRLCLLLGLLFPLAAQTTGEDADGDGLSDALEQALLERFLPRFHVTQGECAGLPAFFAPGEGTPRVLAADGAIYGQAFPLPRPEGPRIELHYFHLWEKDCGRLSHPLDVEGVSVLLAAEDGEAQASGWRALYWYAAAHEETVCDVSHGAHATALHAVEQGAEVFISRAKHASYLSRQRCKLGCGGDSCKPSHEMRVARVLNLGQPGHPLHGADFIGSAAWPLARKMEPDFTETVIQQLAGASPKKIVAVNSALPPVRATIYAGEEILSGTGTGKRHTGSAVKTGKSATESAVGKAFRATGRFLNGEKKAPTVKGDSGSAASRNSPESSAAKP
jgi:hypothetical protein